MSNILETKFVFIDGDLSKVDLTRKSLFALNTDLNNLGKGTNLGQTIANEFEAAGKATDNFKNKINETISKPTISRYWEVEGQKTVGSLKAIENAAIKTNNSLSKIGEPKIKSFTEAPNKSLTEQPIKFDFDELQKKKLNEVRKSFADVSKVGDTQKSFADVSAQRINSGNIGVLTKEIVVAHERARQLAGDIVNIKAELAKPNKKSTIKFLTEELQAAEIESGKLNRRLSTLQSSNARSSNGGRASSNGGRRGGITNAQATFLEFADDFAPEGTNRAFNAVGRAVFAAQNIKEAGKEMSVLSGLSITTLATYGAIAAAAFLIVDATSKIRAEAEKRLKYENAISAAGNAQVKLQRNSLRDFELDRKRQSYERNSFSPFLEKASVDELKNRRTAFEKQLLADPTNEDFKRYISALDAQIDTTFQRRQAARDKEITNQQRFIDSQKQLNNQEIENSLSYSKAIANRDLKGVSLIKENSRLEIEALKKQIQNNNNSAADSLLNLTSGDFDNQKGRQIKQQRDAENAKLQNQIAVTQINSQKQIVDDLKTSKTIVDNLKTKLNQDNPFVSFYIESESAIRKLKDTISDPALLRNALKLQEAINTKKFNALSYESGRKALNFEQDAFRTSRIRDDQFASFERALNTVERKVDFAVKINQLNRDISENDFYARKYNPNNPKNFEEIARRFRGDDPAIRNSLVDVRDLKRIDLGATGIAGQATVASEVLKVLPPLQDLVSALNNPKLAGEARYLLGQRSDALRSVRSNEQKKLNDFLYDQETAGLNRKFAYDQLALLNNQKGLSKGDYANNFLDITKNLGNDLDPYLRRGMYEQNVIAAKDERAKQAQAQQYWKDTAEAVTGLKNALIKIITANGLKIDAKDFPATNVYVDAKDFDIQTDTGASGTQDDVRRTYFEEYN